MAVTAGARAVSATAWRSPACCCDDCPGARDRPDVAHRRSQVGRLSGAVVVSGARVVAARYREVIVEILQWCARGAAARTHLPSFREADKLNAQAISTVSRVRLDITPNINGPRRATRLCS